MSYSVMLKEVESDPESISRMVVIRSRYGRLNYTIKFQ